MVKMKIPIVVNTIDTYCTFSILANLGVGAGVMGGSVLGATVGNGEGLGDGIGEVGEDVGRQRPVVDGAPPVHVVPSSKLIVQLISES